MERAKINGQDLKIKGKSGPFALRKLRTKELLDFGQQAQSKPVHEQYIDIVNLCLVYEKSGKAVFPHTKEGRDKMDMALGGGEIVQLGNRAMVYNHVIEDESMDQKVEDAEKN